MKRLIIGDIHGCYYEMLDLIEKAGLSEDDEIISIGDMVDRGLHSVEVLNFFRETPNARAVMGNHERKHRRVYRDGLTPALSQVLARQDFGEDAYPDAVTYMENLPFYINDIDEALLAHGFYEPGVPLEEQRERVLVGVMGGEKYLAENYDRAWYDLYDGDKPIIVGHRQYLGMGVPLIIEGSVYALDTGCVYGGTLTGLILPDFELISVPSRKDYWSELKSANAHLDPYGKSTD